MGARRSPAPTDAPLWHPIAAGAVRPPRHAAETTLPACRDRVTPGRANGSCPDRRPTGSQRRHEPGRIAAADGVACVPSPHRPAADDPRRLPDRRPPCPPAPCGKDVTQPGGGMPGDRPADPARPRQPRAGRPESDRRIDRQPPLPCPARPPCFGCAIPDRMPRQGAISARRAARRGQIGDGAAPCPDCVWCFSRAWPIAGAGRIGPCGQDTTDPKGATFAECHGAVRREDPQLL